MLDEWRAKLLNIREGIEELRGPVPFPELTEERIEYFREHIPAAPQMKQTPGDRPENHRAWLSEQKRRELEEQEARWADEIRRG